jgi:hypothetical protein
MPRPEHFKQANPTDQLVAIYSAMEGHFSNFEDKITDRARFIEKFGPMLGCLKDLLPFIQGTKSWE